MSFDYESLVGHLYIVGGRALSVPPPGALVEVAPKKAARGREADTFFVLVLPSGDVLGPAQFYEGMAQLAADRYFASSGSVTAGLRHTFDTLNQNLVQHNAQGKRRYEASIVCAVLKGSDLFVGRVGSGISLLYHAGELQCLPENLSDDEAVYRPPLGVHPMPDVRMTRYTIGNGSRLMLADAGLADIDSTKLAKALAGKVSVEAVITETAGNSEAAGTEVKSSEAGDIGMALVSLKEVVLSSLKANITAIGVEFVLPEAPVGANTKTGESTAAVLSGAKSTQETPSVTPKPQPAERRREQRVEKQLQEFGDKAKSGAGAVAIKTAEGLEGAQKVFDHYFPEPEEGKKSWFSSPVAAIAVILIPLVVVGLVLIMWLGGTGESEFEICVNNATDAAELARGVAPSDTTGSRAAWNAVILQVNHCNELRPSGDQALVSLLSEAQTQIDAMDYVERRQGLPIATYPGATLGSLVLQGFDLYALDNVNNLVYHAQLNTDGRSAIPNSIGPIADMRQGANVGSFTVGDIFDIAWAEDAGGSSSGRVIVAVDRDGTVISCPARLLVQCTSHRLLGVENWRNPVAIVIWQGRLYVLDTEAPQIWRYDPSSGNYTSPPSEYFSGEGRPPLELAVDFGITDEGVVYLLLNNGSVLRYRAGNPEDFGFSGFPQGQELTAASNMFLNLNPMSRSLFIVNANTRTIYETSYTGTFFYSYRTFQEDEFASLAGIAVDTNLGMIYATSGNTIFGISRSP
ncbi:MAG: hypothetical protein U0694_13555 [Anaerolineae bacterium]